MTPMPNLSIEQALTADAEVFTGADAGLRAETVSSGASGREFYRIFTAARSRILMAFPSEPWENQIFAEIGRALHAASLPVPQILASNPEQGLVWLEDLGAIDLYSLRNDSGNRFSYYEKAISVLNRIQRLSPGFFQENQARTLTAFDQELYSFEQRYFLEELVRRLDPDRNPPPPYFEEMDRLTRQLSEGPQTWVHRDFQSKNLMIDGNDQIRIVDFQGIRQGNRYYDLASLLCDPYANLHKTERDNLFQHYCKTQNLDPELERQVFRSACCQRLMQALGAFGKLGLGRKIPFFRTPIPAALQLLDSAAKEADLPELRRTVQHLAHCV